MTKKIPRFFELIEKSEKEALKSVFQTVSRNIKSQTGRNLRKIMLLMNKANISELKSSEVKECMKYKAVPENQVWRIPIVKELIEVKAGNVVIEGFTNEEILEMLEHVCVS
jgi:hypothetical protein